MLFLTDQNACGIAEIHMREFFTARWMWLEFLHCDLARACVSVPSPIHLQVVDPDLLFRHV